MPAGFSLPIGDEGFHTTNAMSQNSVGMTGLGDVGGIPIEIDAIDWALDQWAAVSGFTDLGTVYILGTRTLVLVEAVEHYPEN